ncbi:MAG TPA: hypothetical protein VKV17_03740 [Bryobacteraceae bacterium]|nr:hypothetical protein [Bryobacteraceae bacterium]
MIVEIADPVAGVRYTLDPRNKIAHRMTVQAPSGKPALFQTGDALPSPPAGVIVSSGVVPNRLGLK